MCCGRLTVLVVIACVGSVVIPPGRTSCVTQISQGQSHGSKCSCFESSVASVCFCSTPNSNQPSSDDAETCEIVSYESDTQRGNRRCNATVESCCSDITCWISEMNSSLSINVTCNCESATDEYTSVTGQSSTASPTTPSKSSSVAITTTELEQSSYSEGSKTNESTNAGPPVNISLIVGVVVGVGGGIILIVVIVIAIVLLRRRRTNSASNISTAPENSIPNKTATYNQEPCRVTSVYPSSYDNMEAPSGEMGNHNPTPGRSQDSMENDCATGHSTSDPPLDTGSPRSYDNLYPILHDAHETTLLDNQLYGQRSAAPSAPSQ